MEEGILVKLGLKMPAGTALEIGRRILLLSLLRYCQCVNEYMSIVVGCVLLRWNLNGLMILIITEQYDR
jgi:hypothetical protein